MNNRRDIAVLARYAIVIAAMLFAAGCIIYKLVHNTIIDAPNWNKRAQEEMAKEVILYPRRGDILADDGTILATNLTYRIVRIDYASEAFRTDSLVKNIKVISDSLAYYFPQRNAQEWEDYLLKPIRDHANQQDRPHNYPFLSNLSYDDYMRLRTLPFFNYSNKFKCGLAVEERERRVNPFGRMAARSIGVVGELKSDSTHQRHGRWGLEYSLDSLLYGTPGVGKLILLTKTVSPWPEVAPIDGANITTTININMQELVENELDKGLTYCDAEWGVAVLMEVATGDIKAIANLEKDPNGDGYIEAYNRAVRGFEPGSVVKTLSMLIALEDGIVTGPEQTIDTNGSKPWAYQGGRRIKDSHPADYLPARKVISVSSNIGMAKIITSRYESNPAAWRNRLAQLGLFEPMRSGIQGELCPHVDTLPNDRGGRIALARQSYGYTTEFSPLWTLSIYNAIANGGRFVRPRLVTRITNQFVDSIIPVSYIRDRICSERNAAILRDMLIDVVNTPDGTGKILKTKEVLLAGKTGTCNTIIKDENGKPKYDEKRNRLAFCGFFPADNPKYSCIVLVNRPNQNAFGAAGTSGNIFRAIALKLYARGLLNDNVDYAQAEKAGVGRPFASLDKSRHQQLTNHFGISAQNALKGGNTTVPEGSAALPDVTGYGARDAIKVIESAGYNVITNGAGYVAATSPSPGSEAKPGQTVVLYLQP